MITERDLREAIAECEGQRNPNANTCIKLAAYYTILREMYPDDPVYSTAATQPDGIYIDSGSEFAEVVAGVDPGLFLSVVDELMETIRVLNPPLYKSVLRRFR